MMNGKSWKNTKRKSGSFALYKCHYWVFQENMEFPFVGLNTTPFSYKINNNIRVIVGVSTGGAYHLSLDSCFIDGDLNQDSMLNIVDVVYLINIILGIDNTIQLHQDILVDKNFIAGNYNINLMNYLY